MLRSLSLHQIVLFTATDQLALAPLYTASNQFLGNHFDAQSMQM